MTRNMGGMDRIIRAIAAVVIGVLIYGGVLTGVAAWVLGILSLVFLLTSLVSTCPLYMPFRISTRKNAAVDKR